MSSNAIIAPLSRKKKLGYAMLAVVGAVLVEEAAARVAETWWPPQPVDFGLGFDPQSRLFVPDPAAGGWLVTSPQKVVAFRVQRFQRTKPPGTLRVVFLGESSVYQLQDELASLARRMGESLAPRYSRMEIINAGGLSYGSQRLVVVATELLDYGPDFLLIYCGHNEFEEVEQLELASLRTVPLERGLAKLAVFRRLLDLVTVMRVSELQRQHNRRILAQGRPDYERAWRHRFNPADVAERMRSFERNLSIIIAAAQRRNVGVLIGTVPSDLVRPHLPDASLRRHRRAAALIDQGRYEEARELARKVVARSVGRHQSSDLENGIIRRLAAGTGVPLVDVESAVVQAEPHGIPGETLFQDHCHLNEKGRAILIAAYERSLHDRIR